MSIEEYTLNSQKKSQHYTYINRSGHQLDLLATGYSMTLSDHASQAHYLINNWGKYDQNLYAYVSESRGVNKGGTILTYMQTYLTAKI